MLGALVHAGVDPELFRQAVSALGVQARLEIERVNRSGISSTRVRVVTAEGGHDDSHVVLPDHSLGHAHGPHSHDHADRAPDGKSAKQHKHSHDAHSHHGRSLLEIEQLISHSPISAASRAIALRAFRLLGEAEAKIHNIPVEKIHFHEVGAIDAIVDITCAAVGCTALGVDRWVCSPLNVGGGSVKCAHGVFPVPAPATTELLKGAPVYSSGVQAELVTPTGAAILRALDVEFADRPPMTIETTGYGAGSRDLAGLANVVRITVGQAVKTQETADSGSVSVIETAVDDLTPQLVGYVMEQALAAGALDVMVTPVQMKKNRPGHLFTVLCNREQVEMLCGLLLRETTSLGVRVREERRRCLERRFATVQTSWGDIRVKLAYLNGTLANVSPEFDDCRRIAEQHRVPLKVVMQEVIRLYREEQAAAAD